MSAIEDFLNYLKADRGYSLQTVRSYSDSLLSFEIFFRSLDAQLTWERIDVDVIRRWMSVEAERCKTSRTICKELSALRSFYKYLLRTKRIEKNPMRLVSNPKMTVPLPTFLKQSEIDELFDQVIFPDTNEGLRDRTILLLFYHTGIRVSELVGLNRSAINLMQRELKVTGKRNKQRIVPFGEELENALNVYLLRRDELEAFDPEALFLNAKSKRISVAQVRRVVHQYLALVTTQKKKSPHVLRHTFATAMLNNGADLEAIREILGHESIDTTVVYTHTTFADLKKEYERAHPRA